MFKENPRWLFPRSPAEAVSLLVSEEGAVIHGGGTGLLRVKSPAIRTFVDLSRTDLSFIETGPSSTRIGACATYGDLDRTKAASKSLAFLKAAIGAAASTPVRNRITFGGSVADRPVWSDLWPALLCLDARLLVLDETGKEIFLAAAEYLDASIFRRPHLVKEIRLNHEELSFFTHRGTRTAVDFATFSLAFSACWRDRRLSRVKIAVSGATSVLFEEKGAAAALEGESPTPETARKAADLLEAKFRGDAEFSEAYKARWYRTAFVDRLTSLREASK